MKVKASAATVHRARSLPHEWPPASRRGARPLRARSLPVARRPVLILADSDVLRSWVSSQPQQDSPAEANSRRNRIPLRDSAPALAGMRAPPAVPARRSLGTTSAPLG